MAAEKTMLQQKAKEDKQQHTECVTQKHLGRVTPDVRPNQCNGQCGAAWLGDMMMMMQDQGCIGLMRKPTAGEHTREMGYTVDLGPTLTPD